VSTARDEVLGRIRRALGDQTAPVPVPRDYRHAGDLDRAALLDLLTDRLVDYKATVRRTGDAEAALLAALADRDDARVVVPPGLPWSLPGAVVDDGLTAAELDALDGVVTACAVAVAETGTIVLDASPDQGRRAITLVPDYHLCVVRADQVVQTVPEAIARLDPTRPLTWISGPSATTTSSCTGSKACTAPEPSKSSSSTERHPSSPELRRCFSARTSSDVLRLSR
jgi:L-lactate dehydrogenase complex protein LldG